MRLIRFLFAIVLGSTLASCANSAQAQFSPRGGVARNIIRRSIRADADRAKQYAEQYQKTQQRIAAEQEELAAKNAELDRARAGLKSAADNRREAELAVRKKLENERGLPRALEEQAVAKKAFDDAAAPVLKALHETAEYQRAEESEQAARARLQTPVGANGEKGAPRTAAEAGGSAELFATARLDARALEQDKTVLPLKREYEAARQKVLQIRREVAQKLKTDTGVAAAARGIAEARTEIHSAESDVAAAAAQVDASAALLSEGVVDAKPPAEPKKAKR